MFFSNPTNHNSLIIRLKIKFSKLLQEPSFLIGSALVIILSYLVIAPIVSIFSNSMSLTMMDAMLSGKEDGEFTYKYVDRVFISSISEKIFWTPLKNSLIVSFLLGYAVYQLENLDDTKLPVDKEFCLKNRIKVKVGYTNKAEVVGRFQLSPGYYVIIPSTFGPNVDGEFLLRIFSEKALSTAKHLCRFCIQSS